MLYSGILFIPRSSIILAHCLTYLSQPGAADARLCRFRSPYDVWWLDLWRIDGVEPVASMAAARRRHRGLDLLHQTVYVITQCWLRHAM